MFAIVDSVIDRISKSKNRRIEETVRTKYDNEEIQYLIENNS